MRTRKLIAVVLMLSAVPAFARSHRHRRPRQPSWFDYRVFVPSRENLVSQNTMIDALGLPRIKDKTALHEMETGDALVRLTENQYVRISPKLEEDRRYARPWVDCFLQELGQEYYEQFHDQIQVNSAVRTVKTQLRLLRWNHNAAPVHGEVASAHLAGVAVDLQRRGLTREQIRFIQRKLLEMSKLGFVIVEEELKQPCFHIVVTGDYPYPPKIVIPFNSGALDGILNPSPSN
jgi:uncharacterized protein YcbK (DUF882 family)